MTAFIRSGLDGLRTGFRGGLLFPDDDRYDAARKVWNSAALLDEAERALVFEDTARTQHARSS